MVEEIKQVEKNEEGYFAIEGHSKFILVMGRNGQGKSSFCNLLIGEDKCATSDEYHDCSMSTKMYTIHYLDNYYTIIDTPGMNFMKKADKRFALKEEIEYSVAYVEGINNIDCLFYIHQYGQREEIEELFKQIESIFDKQIMKSIVIVITKYDDLISRYPDQTKRKAKEDSYISQIKEDLNGLNTDFPIMFVTCPDKETIENMWGPKLAYLIDEIPKQKVRLLKLVEDCTPYKLTELKARREKLFKEMDKFLTKVIRDPEEYYREKLQDDTNLIIVLPIDMVLQKGTWTLHGILGIIGGTVIGFGIRAGCTAAAAFIAEAAGAMAFSSVLGPIGWILGGVTVIGTAGYKIATRKHEGKGEKLTNIHKKLPTLALANRLHSLIRDKINEIFKIKGKITQEDNMALIEITLSPKPAKVPNLYSYLRILPSEQIKSILGNIYIYIYIENNKICSFQEKMEVPPNKEGKYQFQKKVELQLSYQRGSLELDMELITEKWEHIVETFEK